MEKIEHRYLIGRIPRPRNEIPGRARNLVLGRNRLNRLQKKRITTYARFHRPSGTEEMPLALLTDTSPSACVLEYVVSRNARLRFKYSLLSRDNMRNYRVLLIENRKIGRPDASVRQKYMVCKLLVE